MMKEDTDKVGRIIAAQKPHWSPGSAVGYHSLTYGLIVDQLVPRIDPKKRTTDQFIREEIAEAYGMMILPCCSKSNSLSLLMILKK